MRALLIGQSPGVEGQWEFVSEAPYEAVVIGSMTIGELLCFHQEQVLEALAQGVPVIVYTPGLPQSPKNRALAASLAAAQRTLKNWGVVFSDGSRRRLITAEMAKLMKQRGQHPGPGAVLTPMAKDILEGLQ